MIDPVTKIMQTLLASAYTANTRPVYAAFLLKKYAEIWYIVAGSQLPHLVPHGSGWCRSVGNQMVDVTKPNGYR